MNGTQATRPPSRRRLMLTGTDVRLFRWLWMLRILTLDQLRRLGYYQSDTGELSSLHNVRKRLRRLWKAGYLRGDTLLDSRERLYFLAERALGPLREHYGIDQRQLYRPKSHETLGHVRHPLLVSECAVRVVESLRSRMVELADLLPHSVPFYHTHAVGDPTKKKHVERFVTQEDISVPGRAAPLRIRPDLVFGLKLEGQQRLFFLEADRGSESPQQIAEKLEGYHFYRKARDLSRAGQYRWQQYGAFADFRVLVVTTTQQRVEALWQRLTGNAGFEVTAFTTAADVSRRNVVFDPIWRIADGTRRALLKESGQ